MRNLRHTLVLLFITAAAVAQPRPPEGRPRQQQQHHPWDNDLWILNSADGMAFDSQRVFVSRAGVPSMCKDAKGRMLAVFQWFPEEPREAFDRVAVAISDDAGATWSAPTPIVVEGFPANYMRPFDPTLVLLPDGRLRLYYTSRINGVPSLPSIHSAISEDGVHYTFEPGQRFGVDGQMVIDCAVGRLGKTWHLYSPVQDVNGRGYHAVSEDGLTFRRVEDVTIDVSRRRHWLGNVLSTADGLRFYGTGDGGVWSAFSTDGANWKLDPGSRGMGADPAIGDTATGKSLLIVTGPPRRDAPR